MKKIILLIALGMIILRAQSQILKLSIDSVSKKYSYVEVVKCDSLISDTALYYATKDWALNQGLNLNRLKDDKADDKALVTALFGQPIRELYCH